MKICINTWMKTCFHSHFYTNFHASVTLLFFFGFSWNFHQNVELRNWEWYSPFLKVFIIFELGRGRYSARNQAYENPWNVWLFMLNTVICFYRFHISPIWIIVNTLISIFLSLGLVDNNTLICDCFHLYKHWNCRSAAFYVAIIVQFTYRVIG